MTGSGTLTLCYAKKFLYHTLGRDPLPSFSKYCADTPAAKLSTVEVSNTGHIIMFKVILKLFAATFSPFFGRKGYTNNSTSHI
jgi:hypothetical protein